MREPQLDAQPECSQHDSGAELVELPSDRETGARRSVLGRVDCVIGAFDRADHALTLHELTERTGLPKSTVHRMIDQLVAIGWIEREVSGYRIGMRLFEIGGLASRRSRLSDLANPHLHASVGGHRARRADGDPRRYRRGLPGAHPNEGLPAPHPPGRAPARVLHRVGQGDAGVRRRRRGRGVGRGAPGARRPVRSPRPGSSSASWSASPRSGSPSITRSRTRGWRAWPPRSAAAAGPSAPCRSADR